MPGKFPSVQYHSYDAFYLDPHGCTGAEAIIYLQSYNEAIRQEHQRSGRKLLNECWGDFSEKGENAYVCKPPTDETIQMVAETLKNRLPGEQTRLKALIADRKDMVNDGETGSERRNLSAHARALEKILKQLPQSQPTFAELRAFFWAEYQARLQSAISPELRASLAALQEQREAAAQAEAYGLEATPA